MGKSFTTIPFFVTKIYSIYGIGEKIIDKIVNNGKSQKTIAENHLKLQELLQKHEQELRTLLQEID